MKDLISSNEGDSISCLKAECVLRPVDNLICMGLPGKIPSRKGTEASYVDEVNRQIGGIDGAELSPA